jgi:hypothetical protein
MGVCDQRHALAALDLEKKKSVLNIKETELNGCAVQNISCPYRGSNPDSPSLYQLGVYKALVLPCRETGRQEKCKKKKNCLENLKERDGYKYCGVCWMIILKCWGNSKIVCCVDLKISAHWPGRSKCDLMYCRWNLSTFRRNILELYPKHNSHEECSFSFETEVADCWPKHVAVYFMYKRILVHTTAFSYSIIYVYIYIHTYIYIYIYTGLL